MKSEGCWSRHRFVEHVNADSFVASLCSLLSIFNNSCGVALICLGFTELHCLNFALESML